MIGGVAFIPIFLAAVLVIGLMMTVLMGGNNASGNSAGGGFGWGPGSISNFGESDIPAQFLPIYQAAAEKYGTPWNLLASIHRKETTFSTHPTMISSAGAEGHMQFMPCTFVGWGHPSCAGGLGKGDFTTAEKESPAMIAQYGGYGVDANGDGKASMWDIEDAIFSAAHYLAKSGASSGNIEGAVHNYNRDPAYVAEVMKYATLYVEQGYNVIEVPQAGQNGFVRPISGAVTSNFGMRTHPITGKQKLHAGVDFGCSIGEPVPASKAGKVIFSAWQNANDHGAGYGQYVRIDHGGGYVTTYAHLSRLMASVGDTVQAGSVIGECGSTGGSTGPHLHFEIIINGSPVDPMPFVGGK